MNYIQVQLYTNDHRNPHSLTCQGNTTILKMNMIHEVSIYSLLNMTEKEYNNCLEPLGDREEAELGEIIGIFVDQQSLKKRIRKILKRFQDHHIHN